MTKVVRTMGAGVKILALANSNGALKELAKALSNFNIPREQTLLVQSPCEMTNPSTDIKTKDVSILQTYVDLLDEDSTTPIDSSKVLKLVNTYNTSIQIIVCTITMAEKNNFCAKTSPIAWLKKPASLPIASDEKQLEPFSQLTMSAPFTQLKPISLMTSIVSKGLTDHTVFNEAMRFHPSLVDPLSRAFYNGLLMTQIQWHSLEL
uniref:Uncharacterized protein n=1 Tax=Ditylenchus dipsaci TaxID=166011 RepID=A0A915DPV2_9BILA